MRLLSPAMSPQTNHPAPVPPDRAAADLDIDAEVAQIERNLMLTYAERLDQLVRTVAFIEAGRAALSEND